MTRQMIIRGGIAVLLGAVLLWAGEPWLEKPYTQWTQQDIDRLSQDSPWAQMIRIIGGEGGEPAIARETVDSTRPMAGRDVAARPSVQAEFVVQWASALIMRQAAVRQRQLQGTITPEQAAQVLSVPPPQYILIVFGPSMKGFQESTEDGVRAAAYLEFKQSKQKVPPAQVQFVRDGQKVVQVDFYFPRQVEGKALPGAGEKKVKFYCHAGKDTISVDFDLRKMTREGAPDL